MSLFVSPVNGGGITLEVKNTSVIFSGRADTSNPGQIMEPFLQEVHTNIIKNSMKNIDLNLVALTYLNSAGIKEIVNWIMKLNSLNEEQKYNITIKYNPEIKWQGTFVDSMIYLNNKNIKKETV